MPEELLLEPPERRLVLAHDTRLAPAGERARGLLGRSRQGQVDDVVAVVSQSVSRSSSSITS